MTPLFLHPNAFRGTDTPAAARRLRRLLWMALCLVLFGCAGLGTRLLPPRIQISAIAVEQIQGLETVLRVDLRVMNGNESALHLRGVDCELFLNDKKFAAGVSAVDIRIPAFETRMIPVTVYSSVIDLVRGLVDFPKTESLSYRIKGRVRLGGNAAPSVIPFSAEGTLAAEKLRRQ